MIELGSTARIVAKIEDQTGVYNMDEIVRETDALMVARGDLGIEIDYHRLPLVQTQLVRACQAEGKPVIIATHLLESMIQSPMPTRAEISDVSNAVREQADAVMLSGETTTGAYPLESVQVMKNIIGSIEPSVSLKMNSRIMLREPKAKMLRSAAGAGSGTGAVRNHRLHAEWLLGLCAGRTPPPRRSNLCVHRHRRHIPATASALGRRTVLDGLLGRS